jgi:hypothetical protein
MKLFSKRQEPAQHEPETRQPWQGDNITEWDGDEYEAIQVDGADTQGATRGYYLRHIASQVLVGRIRPDRSK